MTDQLLHAALQGVADEWEQILSELHPQYSWVTWVRQPDRADTERQAAAAVTGEHASAVLEDADTVIERNVAATPNGRDHHRLDQAA